MSRLTDSLQQDEQSAVLCAEREAVDQGMPVPDERKGVSDKLWFMKRKDQSWSRADRDREM